MDKMRFRKLFLPCKYINFFKDSISKFEGLFNQNTLQMLSVRRRLFSLFSWVMEMATTKTNQEMVHSGRNRASKDGFQMILLDITIDDMLFEKCFQILLTTLLRSAV